MSQQDEQEIYQAEPLQSEEEAETIKIPETETVQLPVEPVLAPQPILEPEVEPESDELDDLFEVPQPGDNDMVVDHLVATPEEDDLSDLTAVSDEDIMGDGVEEFPGTPPSTEIPQRTKPVRRFKRTNKRFPTPPTSLGGIRG